MRTSYVVIYLELPGMPHSSPARRASDLAGYPGQHRALDALYSALWPDFGTRTEDQASHRTLVANDLRHGMQLGAKPGGAPFRRRGQPAYDFACQPPARHGREARGRYP